MAHAFPDRSGIRDARAAAASVLPAILPSCQKSRRACAATFSAFKFEPLKAGFESLRHRFDITRIGRIGPRSGCIKSRWRLSRISLEGTIAVPCSHLLHKQFPARGDGLFISRRRPLRLSEILAEQRSGIALRWSMRVLPPPSSTDGRHFSGQADLKSRANSAAAPHSPTPPATRIAPSVYALCASFRNGSSHSLSSRCDKARNSMC